MSKIKIICKSCGRSYDKKEEVIVPRGVIGVESSHCAFCSHENCSEYKEVFVYKKKKIFEDKNQVGLF